MTEGIFHEGNKLKEIAGGKCRRKIAGGIWQKRNKSREMAANKCQNHDGRMEMVVVIGRRKMAGEIARDK